MSNIDIVQPAASVISDILKPPSAELPDLTRVFAKHAKGRRALNPILPGY